MAYLLIAVVIKYGKLVFGYSNFVFYMRYSVDQDHRVWMLQNISIKMPETLWAEKKYCHKHSELAQLILLINKC